VFSNCSTRLTSLYPNFAVGDLPSSSYIHVCAIPSRHSRRRCPRFDTVQRSRRRRAPCRSSRHTSKYIVAAFQAYDAVRWPRSQRAVTSSRENADLLCLSYEGAATTSRYGIWRGIWRAYAALTSIRFFIWEVEYGPYEFVWSKGTLARMVRPYYEVFT
jgi:hypothetical protein